MVDKTPDYSYKMKTSKYQLTYYVRPEQANSTLTLSLDDKI